MGGHIVEIDGVATSVAAAMEEQDAATREIARSISELASAAKQVSAKIAHVSRDADFVNQRASEMRQGISSVSSNLASLQTILVRTVRGSTTEVDRRSSPRYPTDLEVSVTDGARAVHATRLVDISDGGAWLRCAPQIKVGETGVLRIKSLALPLPFGVRSHDGEAAHVAFTLDAGQKAELFRLVGTQFRRGRGSLSARHGFTVWPASRSLRGRCKGFSDGHASAWLTQKR